MKTEYRIIPEKTYLADQYLQFKRTVNGNEEWCFVPDELITKVSGHYLTINDCFTVLSTLQAGWCIRCYNNEQEKKLIPFAKKYPDIEKYFEKLRELRVEYVERKKKEHEANNKIVYL